MVKPDKDADKEKIIRLVKRWQKRAGLGADKLLARLQVRGCDITRAEFENRFTTRADHKPNIAPQLTLALIAAFTAEDLTSRERCTLEEALELADLARLPPSRFADLKRLFPAADLEAAYHRFVFGNDALPPNHTRHASQPPHRLPTPLTGFIGREHEVNAVKHLLTQARLLTLTGPGGCGKTRLALQVAADLRDEFADGVFFVSLAPLGTPAWVVPTIARTLGIAETTEESLGCLQDYLRNKQTLLVLDNFEHLTDAAPLVGELLTAAPRVKVLATSRASLNVRGEREFPVPPLALPDLEHLPVLAALTRCEAIALFVARAQAVKSDWALTEENAAVVAEICTRLDGLPLAIEMAAAHSKLLAPPTLLERLCKTRLGTLWNRARDVPARQQTLRATLDWSYNLLDPDEKNLFARLAVFVGGFTAEAVEAVTGDARRVILQTSEVSKTSEVWLGTRPPTALTCLASLADQSLVRVQGADGSRRLTLLETIREYALERLQASGESESLRRRHAEYYLALAEQAESEFRGPCQKVWLERLENEHANLRAALEWTLEHRDMAMAARLARALEPFWYWRGHLSEGRSWSEALLTLTRGNSRATTAHATLLDVTGGFAWAQGDLAQAMALGLESLALFRASGDKRGIASALNTLGLIAEDQGDFGRAIALYEESLALWRALGVTRGVILLLHNLGDAVLPSGDHVRAVALATESLAMCRAANDTRGIAASLCQLGNTALYQGAYAQAVRLYTESLTLYQQVDHKKGIIFCLEGLADTAWAQQQPARAAQWWDAAEALRAAIGASIPPARRAHYEQMLGAFRACRSNTFART